MAARSVTPFERRPVISAILLFVAYIVMVALAGVTARAIGAGGMRAAFIALCVATVIAVLVLSALRW